MVVVQIFIHYMLSDMVTIHYMFLKQLQPAKSILGENLYMHKKKTNCRILQSQIL